MRPAVFRFAPSPNGDLHLGHALSALTNRDRAAAVGGRLLVRIEDIDLARCTPAFEKSILDDLAWLGLEWEQPVRRQSEHFDAYAGALERLTALGLVYPAFLSRGEIKARVEAAEAEGRGWPRDPDGAPLYPGDDRDLDPDTAAARIAAGAPFAYRLRMDLAVRRAAEIDAAPLDWLERGPDPTALSDGLVAADPAAWGDVVVARKEVPTSYHLSVVVDDALQGVTDVVRGRDLFAATSVHRLLQVLLGLPAPAYHHHRLILDDSGRKLSKSAGDTSLKRLRAGGLTVAALRRQFGLAP